MNKHDDLYEKSSRAKAGFSFRAIGALLPRDAGEQIQSRFQEHQIPEGSFVDLHDAYINTLISIEEISDLMAHGKMTAENLREAQQASADARAKVVAYDPAAANAEMAALEIIHPAREIPVTYRMAVSTMDEVETGMLLADMSRAMVTVEPGDILHVDIPHAGMIFVDLEVSDGQKSSIMISLADIDRIELDNLEEAGPAPGPSF